MLIKKQSVLKTAAEFLQNIGTGKNDKTWMMDVDKNAGLQILYTVYCHVSNLTEDDNILRIVFSDFPQAPPIQAIHHQGKEVGSRTRTTCQFSDC